MNALRISFALLGALLAFGPRPAHAGAAPAKLPFQKGDRVVFIGDTFAERAAQFGYLETLFHAHHPELRLTFRNLGYSADTVGVHVADMTKGDTESNRGSNRALNFGTMPRHLEDAQADVIVMCFGMADSFAGEAGLPDFTKNLQFLIKEHTNKQYNGKSAPRLVLVGPIAHEKLGGPYPDPAKHNADLKRYTEAMRKVAAEHKLPFADLYTPMLQLMDEAAHQKADRLTVNGIHLNATGYWAVAHHLLKALGEPMPGSAAWVNKDGAFLVKTPTLPAPPIPARKYPTRLTDYLPRLRWGEFPVEGPIAVVINNQRCEDQPPNPWQAVARVLASSPMQADAERLRLAVVAQNQEWFHRWRAVNGEYIYGRRAKPFGVVNFPGEMEQLAKNVNALDAKIHQLSQPGQYKGQILSAAEAEKRKIPPVERVSPGVPLPEVEKVYEQRQGIIGGKVVPTAADLEEARKSFKLQEGYEISLFASEKDFPMHDALAMAWDSKGRLWVTTMPSYPQAIPGVPPNDKILILEDTDGDGKADKHTTFAEGLYLPTGMEFGDGGVYVASQPNMLFLKDTDGDDKADVSEVILHGFGTGDSHHALHMFVRSPEGALHFQEGIFHRTNVETPWGVVRQRDAGIYRFEPRNQKLDVYVSYNFANPWGHVFDRWGFNFIADASGGSNYNALPLTGRVEFPDQHPGMKVFTTIVRPTCGCEIVSSRHFPEAAQGNFLVNNTIGFQGIKQHKLIEEGSGFTSKELEPLLQSTDRNFRPVDIKFGPDGALYIVDWYNPLVGHMQHSLRDPGRDHFHGRIWRITAKGRPLVEPARMHGEPTPRVLDLLKSYEDRTRYRARAELRDRDPKEVKAALTTWVKGLKEGDADYEHHLLEALWVAQGIDAVDENLLTRLLHAKDYRARAGATRALRHWREHLPTATVFQLLEGQVNDEHPRVRLEAVVALSYFKDARAAEIALLALNHPRDYYLDYGLKETMATLEPHWKAAIAGGKAFAANNPAGATYVLSRVSTNDLTRMPRSGAVYTALLTREGVLPQFRQEALTGLAKQNRTDYLTELLSAVERIDQTAEGHAGHVLHDLTALLTARDAKELGKIRPRLEKLAAGAKAPMTRQLAFVAMATADASLERVWKEASSNIYAFRDLVEAVSILPDAKLRGESYERVKDLLTRMPPEIAAQATKAKGTNGRFVRIELTGDTRVLTLAEVEVFSGGVNVARQGTAKQSSTAQGGDAKRAIDGNTSGRIADRGLTLTTDPAKNPWWEVDLGREMPIEAITVYNRTDDILGKRLEGFTLSVLDTHRHPVLVKENQPAPAVSTTFRVEGSPAEAIKLAAINALTAIPGKEEEVFTTLAKMVQQGQDRDAAVRALRRLPKNKWPREELKPLAENIVAHAAKLKAEERAEPAVLDALQLGADAAALLPPAEAKALQAQLGQLGVQIVLVRTIPHNMVFDVAEFTVEAGRPVVIVLENNDIMPHNLVLIEPGTLEDVGQAAERMANDPDGFARGFVPKNRNVLHATRLLQPRETDRLKITAPKQPGKYTFVCTFPGHWTVMNGTVNVVPNLEAVASTDRVKYLEEKKWKLEELAGDVEKITHGRSFARGKELFKLRSCVQCHTLGGEGGNLGPDLAELPKKLGTKTYSKTDLLREVLDPSAVIDKKFRMVSITLDTGTQVQGLVIHEDKDVVRLAKNAQEKPIDIKQAEIEERVEIPSISMMPHGLLDRLNREEVLDLLAYIATAGDPAHPAFRRKE